MCDSHLQEMCFTHYAYNSISNMQQYIVQLPTCMFGLRTCARIQVGLETSRAFWLGWVVNMCMYSGCMCVRVACTFANVHRVFFGLAKM